MRGAKCRQIGSVSSVAVRSIRAIDWGRLTLTITAKAILSTVFIASLVAPVLAADLPRKATKLAVPVVADRCAKVEPAPGTPAVPGGDIFGFTSPTDIGDPCSWALASENSGRVGRRDGSYFALSSKTQLAYTYSDRVAFAMSAFTAHTDWSNVTAAQIVHANEGGIVTGVDQLQFDGISGEILVRLLYRSRGQPFAVTVSAEPRWSRVDALVGLRADGYGAEFKLFVDVALSDRLFAAMNLNYALATHKIDIINAPWVDSSSTNISAALMTQVHSAEKQFIEGVFLGFEGRFRSSFAGLALDQNTGNAFSLGPNLAFAFEGGRMLNLAWTPQVAGRARPASASGSLDLDNYDRHEFRIKFAASIP